MRFSGLKIIGFSALAGFIAAALIALVPSAVAPVAKGPAQDRAREFAGSAPNAEPAAIVTAQFGTDDGNKDGGDTGRGLAHKVVAKGAVTSRCNRGQCASPRATAQLFAAEKQDLDPTALDAAFAPVPAGEGADGGTASKAEEKTANPEIYHGSFAALGGAGDPPSGQ